MNGWLLNIGSSLIVGALASLAPAAIAAPQETGAALGAPVTSFDAAIYCDTVDRDAPIAKPDDVTAALAPDSSIVDGHVLASAVLVSAAIDIAHASADPQTCLNSFEEGAARFAETFDEAMENIRDSRRHRFDRDEPIRSIQQRLAELWQRDQAGRFAYINLQTDDEAGAEFWAARLSVAYSTQTDEDSKRFIEDVLQDYHWIDRDQFGDVYADHAWIMVQHADDYPDFQAEVLGRMRTLLESGNLRRRHYAYLHDRVAVNRDNPQYYGTQPTWECEDGQLSLAPLEDPENVNERRAAMGLNSVEEGLAEMSRAVCGG